MSLPLSGPRALLLVGVGVWLTSGIMAATRWTVHNVAEPVPLGAGVLQMTKEASGPVKTELQVVCFDTAQCRLAVVAQPVRENAVSLAELGARCQALAVCNGGYFSPEFRPAGLQIADGVREGAFQQGVLWGGGLLVRRGKPELFLEQEFSDSTDPKHLIQCWPVLVAGGKIFSGTGPDTRTRRTFIMTDGAGKWALGVAERIGLGELANLLVAPGLVTEWKVSRALNLDGGPSTGLWYRGTSGKSIPIREMWPVKNALVVLPSS